VNISPNEAMENEVWRTQVRRKIAEGMESIRAGQVIQEEEIKAGMAAFKKKARKNRGHQ
jgi:predicted transcriptional regulator